MPKIPWDLITSVVIAILGSTWFANLIQSHSQFSNKALMKRMDTMEEEREKDKADSARRRILAFDGELRRKVPHTEEQFNNNNEDIDYYINYCTTHPNYKNTKAVSAIDHSTKAYQEHLAKDDFL